MSLCICVVLSWNELKVRQNLLASDCEIYIACLLVAVYWHKLLQFVKKSLTLHSELVYLWFISCFDDHIMLYYIPARFEFQFIYLLHLIISVAWQAWHLQIQRWINLRNTKRWFFFPLCMVSKKPFRNYCFQKNKMSRSINDSFVGGSQRMVTKSNLIDKLHTDLANWSVVIASYLTC